MQTLRAHWPARTAPLPHIKIINLASLVNKSGEWNIFSPSKEKEQRNGIRRREERQKKEKKGIEREGQE